MIKKTIILLIMVVSLFGCTVNQYTGHILVRNNTTEYISNIKLGDTVLSNGLFSGGKTDYYYVNELEGKLSADGTTPGYFVNSIMLERKGNFKLKLNRWYICEIYAEEGKKYINIRPGEIQNINPYSSEAIDFEYYED